MEESFGGTLGDGCGTEGEVGFGVDVLKIYGFMR